MHQAFSIIAKTHCIILQALTGFLYGFSKTSSDGHYFTYTFHLQSKRIIGAFELIKIPAGYFYNYIIQCRFKIGRSGFCDLIFQFIQMYNQWPVWQQSLQ